MRIRTIPCCLAALTLAACSVPLTGDSAADLAASQATPADTGLALTVDYLADSGTGGFHFEVRAIDCPAGSPPLGPNTTDPITASAGVDLEDATLGAHPDNIFDPQSGHLFADRFFTLAAGCYHVTASPRDASGGATTTCADAYAEAEVVDGQTTEILLVSQCEGEARGALDVLGALNHPPEIVAVIQESPGKFVFQCEWAEICVDVTDPDDDPIEVVLSFVGIQGQAPAPTTLDQQMVPGGGSGQVCFAYTSDPLGAHTLAVHAYDLLDTDDDGTPDQRVEDYLAAEINPAPPSHDDLEFPLYVQQQVMCDDNGSPRMLDRGLYVRTCNADPATTPFALAPCPPLPTPEGTCCHETAGTCFEVTHGGAAACLPGETFNTATSCNPSPCAPPPHPGSCNSDNALPASSSNASCRAILESGGSTGDGLYTINPSGTPVQVYCDMTTAGGGWTLVAHAPQAKLHTGSLLTATINYNPSTRSGAGHINASDLIHMSQRVAYAWTPAGGGVPSGNIGSHTAAVWGNIGDPANQDLSAPPDAGGRPCATQAQQTYWCEQFLVCIVGNCNLPSDIQSPTRFQDACYGKAFGMALSNGNPQCDWHIDGQGFRAVYMEHTAAFNCSGIVENPGGSSNWIMPDVMTMWFY